MINAIYRGPDREFEVNSEAQLWINRMIIGEAGYFASREHVSALLWALTNRYLLHPGRKCWGGFLGMLRLFSQPINPRWQRDGDLARKYITRHGNTGACTEAKFLRREKICLIAPYDVPPNYLDWSYQFRYGFLTLPENIMQLKQRRISNWAAHTKRLEDKHPNGFDIGGNWFLADPELDEGTVDVILRYWR